MTSFLEEVVSECYHEFFPNCKGPIRFSFIMERSDRKVLFYIFRNTDSFPVLFAKASDNSEVGQRLMREYKVLSEIHALHNIPIKNTIPKPFCGEKFGNYWMIIESTIKGHPLSNYIRKRTLPFWKKTANNHFNLAANWLVSFHSTTTHRVLQLRAQELKDFFVNLMGDFCRSWGMPYPNSSFILALSNLLDDCQGRTLPLVKDHGDYSPHQILVRNGDIAIIDWELSPFWGLPIIDLVIFSLYYRTMMKGTFVPVKFTIQDMESTFFQYNDFSELVAQHMKRYCNSLRIDPIFIKPLILLRFMFHPEWEHVYEKLNGRIGPIFSVIHKG